MSEEEKRIEADREAIRKRYETLVSLYNEQFLAGLAAKYKEYLYLSKELLHCAVKAYFDDICKYKAYAGSTYADRHKQAAYTMMWISRFKPIQIKEGGHVDTPLLTINESFAIYAGLMFLAPSVMQGMTEKFYKHLIYTLTYRELGGRGLASLLYLMETAAQKNVKF